MALNRVVQSVGEEDPVEILKALNRLVRITLGQNVPDSPTDDGLDIGICLVDPAGSSLTFAGARIGLFVIQDGKVEEIHGDRKSIGYKRSDPEYTFTSRDFKLSKDASIYLTTDGIFGQVGGDSRLPFGKRRFIRMFKDHYQETMTIQKQIVEETLRTYMGEEDQRDDITVIGFRL
jgi:serine phosphatase RsbU (regulator of sigma subunit)